MWRREERQNSHPSKRTNNGFWNTKKPVLWTLYQDDIIYPRYLFYSTNASGAKKIPESKSQSNLTMLRIPTGRGQNGYLQHCSREFEHRTNKNKSS